MTRAQREQKIDYIMSRFKSTPPNKSPKAQRRFENVVYNLDDKGIEHLYDIEKRKELADKELLK